MLTTLFALPAQLLVEDILFENQVLTLVITSTLSEMPCPDCRQPATLKLKKQGHAASSSPFRRARRHGSLPVTRRNCG